MNVRTRAVGARDGQGTVAELDCYPNLRDQQRYYLQDNAYDVAKAHKQLLLDQQFERPRAHVRGRKAFANDCACSASATRVAARRAGMNAASWEGGPIFAISNAYSLNMRNAATRQRYPLHDLSLVDV